MDYLLSRHPIFRSKIDVTGYEIRCRPIGDKAAVTPDAERSMFSLLADAKLDQIVGPHSCFISVTPETLMDGEWRKIPSNRVVLGYFNDFNPSDDVARELLKLIEGGSRIALSGTLNPDALGMFANRAHALKLDVTSFAPDELEHKFHELKQYKAQLLAGSVDTYDDLEWCKTLGFDLYQGHFIARSSAHEEKQIPVNRLAMMKVLSQLQDPDLSMTELEKTIALDTGLSYKLLTYSNSAAVALPRKVTSVGHAVRLIGLQLLRTWTSVLLLSSVDDKPRELMTISLVRARMCEKLSASLKNAEPDSFFSAGLLSVVDALLDCPMEKALASLPLVDEVKEALISKTGPVGQALRCAIAYEQSDWDNVQFYGMAPGPIRDIYVDAITWARQLQTGLLP